MITLDSEQVANNIIFSVEINCTYLDQQRVTKTQSTLQVLPEGIIQETSSGDLAIFVLIHNKLCGLARWIND